MHLVELCQALYKLRDTLTGVPFTHNYQNYENYYDIHMPASDGG